MFAANPYCSVPFAETAIGPGDAAGEVNGHAQCRLCDGLSKYRTYIKNADAVPKAVGVVNVRKKIALNIEHRSERRGALQACLGQINLADDDFRCSRRSLQRLHR